MKRFLILALALMLAFTFCATAQDVVYRPGVDPIIAEWDPPTVDVNGDLLDVSTFTLTYEVYRYDYDIGVSDDQDPSLLVFMGEVSDPTITFTLPYIANWGVGCRAKYIAPDGQFLYSGIHWSYTGGYPVPFWYAPFFAPVNPENFRDASQ